ncbi:MULTISPECIES: LysE family translocator [unclassified Pantoea]|uniref:LysE family translocator n=1 Tax=unclassified Pantoea TaxID=2630326 RepID=UPI0028ADC9F7|nr:LysE family translocator [Pantoea sp.]
MDGDLLALAATGGALLLGAMSPGPSFLLVARTAVASSRRAGLFVSAGMGVGSILFALVALAGLHTVLTLVPSLYTTLKIAGGCYLLWLALNMFRPGKTSSAELTQAAPISAGRAFGVGLITQISNPHTALVFASIFTATLSAHISLSMYIALPIMAFVIDAGWYVVVALALSTERPRRIYMKYRRFIDKTSGAIMATLGVRLLLK